jgi:hypothetical protein
MIGVAARHLPVDITAHTSMAPAVRATGPGRGRPGICVSPAADPEDHRRRRPAALAGGPSVSDLPDPRSS